MKNADVVIIGGGVIGASIAYYLTSMGARKVILCEQAMPPGIGATMTSGGLLRLHHTTRWMAKLTWDSYPTFMHWSDIIGGDCDFHKTGFAMVVGEEHKGAFEQNMKMLRELGIPTLSLSLGDFQYLQPYCSTENIAAVAYEPESGYADPARSTLCLLKQAQVNGLEVMSGVRIINLEHAHGRVVGVRTDSGVIQAETVVLAGGAWSSILAEPLGVKIPITTRRICICFLRATALPMAPTLCTYIDDTIGTYFRSSANQQVMLGVPLATLPGNPNATPVPLTDEEIAAARERLAVRVPSLATAPVMTMRSGFDGYTPDKHPVIGPAPHWDGLYLAAGFSGGGFKIAPAVGRLVASELIRKADEEDLKVFRLERFEAGQLLSSQSAYNIM